MNLHTIQRIYGVIGGVLLVRAADSFVGSVTLMLSPVGDVSARATGALPAIAVLAFSATFAMLYLRGRVQRWVHWIVMILLGVGAAFSVFAAVLPFVIDSKVEGMRGMMLAGAATKLLVTLALMVCVASLLRREEKKPNQALQTTPMTPSEI